MLHFIYLNDWEDGLKITERQPRAVHPLPLTHSSAPIVQHISSTRAMGPAQWQAWGVGRGQRPGLGIISVSAFTKWHDVDSGATDT